MVSQQNRPFIHAGIMAPPGPVSDCRLPIDWKRWSGPSSNYCLSSADPPIGCTLREMAPFDAI